MQKVQMTVHGMQALVDADMVKLMTKKEALVKAASAIQQAADTMSAAEHLAAMDAIVKQIIRINRRIRQNVQFI
jgi:hypothetical protein